MKTLVEIKSLPSLVDGISIIVEGNLLRLFFDFENVSMNEDMPQDGSIKACMSVDVKSRSYADIVSAIITDKYSVEQTQAIIGNYENAKDSESDISELKRMEYIDEYRIYQEWRKHAKEIARSVVSRF